MTRPDADEVLEVLAARVDVLAALARQPRKTSELTADLPVSRSTIDRGLRKLERVGFVETVDGAHHLTLAGWLALDAYDQFDDQLDDIDAAATALEPLESDVSIDPVFLHGSDVVVANGGDENAVISHLTSVIDEAEAVRGCSRDASEKRLDTYHRRIVEDQIPVELVVTDEVVQRLITSYRAELADACAAESFSLHSVESLPYDLIVAERPGRSVALLVTHDSGTPFGLIYTERPEGVSWARQQIADWRASSSPLPLPSFDDT
ncbi:hypothetical protein C440_00130 [Haloferax mucosum ATCC BAA-1512]|uniref:HTH arsR-type domain-containing protein n=1 Tax=Haloferax mucosum ATCC BAA-1512 TaxID=662479 RepID=M0IPG1_9EURY|nr:ArsR family transcriptional regulator [Haloferax mucosum]ELZ98716.1 hypothetical protein C440_00130 [Haloferax mucosum ATCC BAA-1512]